MTSINLCSRGSSRTRTFAARWILPIDDRPIKGGWIGLQGGRITEIQSGNPPGDAKDLGDVALLPGLVNAHTHLEFSDFHSPLGEPGIPLSQWIVEVIQARIHLPRDPNIAVAQGWRESRDGGIRLLGDIATPPVHYPDEDPSSTLPIQCVSFAEVLGLTTERFADRYGAMEKHRDHDQDERIVGGISPHAPYSLSHSSIQRCAHWSSRNRAILAMHVAESPAERELLVQGTGSLKEQLSAMGFPLNDHFPWTGGDSMQSPFINLIEILAGCHRGLVVHANDLRDHEIEQLAKHDHLSVVFCPRTHAFFQFPRHPVDQMLRAGIRVALGTDSRASNPDLKLWNEVRHLLNHRQDIQPEHVIKMATASGADALGRPDLGRLKVGTQPGLVAVATTAKSVDHLYRDLASNDAIRV